MKIKILSLFVLFLIVGQTGCKKYLDVKPLDHLAGNAFFQDRKDVESNLWDIYGLLRDKIASTVFFPGTGDIRGGMMAPSPEVGGIAYRTLIPKNDLLTLVNQQNNHNLNLFKWYNLTKWKGFYQVIQSANNLYFELTRKPIEDLSSKDIKRYQGEAVFLRCITYFLMIRIWGDVPYYTDAYHEDPLPRLDMVKVANNCLKDLAKVKDNMPWTYSEPAYLGVRATRGAVIALMMNLDMWNAGFDKENAEEYEKQAAELGKELVYDNEGAYDLLPIKDFHKIFKGRTKESLFEIGQNSNYGELIQYRTFADMVLHYPYKKPISSHPYSYFYFRPSFLDVLYPIGQPDLRIEYWFDENMRSANGDFQYLKFTNVWAISDNEDVNPDNNIEVFRYAGLILLRAEALAKTGNDAEAIKMLNMVRSRARATLYSGGGGQPLIDAIFIERAKELMGEGHYYYDLVRTGRVLDQKWCYYPLTKSQFENGGWTWPLSDEILNNNPLVHVNNYWVN